MLKTPTPDNNSLIEQAQNQTAEAEPKITEISVGSQTLSQCPEQSGQAKGKR